MEINNLDDLLYKYPDEAVTMFTVMKIFQVHGFNVPKARQAELHISWSRCFSEWHITLELDGYDDELIASIRYASANNEGELRFRIVDEQGSSFSEYVNIPLTFIKITEVTV